MSKECDTGCVYGRGHPGKCTIDALAAAFGGDGYVGVKEVARRLGTSLDSSWTDKTVFIPPREPPAPGPDGELNAPIVTKTREEVAEMYGDGPARQEGYIQGIDRSLGIVAEHGGDVVPASDIYDRLKSFRDFEVAAYVEEMRKRMKSAHDRIMSACAAPAPIAGTPATMLGEALGHLGRAEMLAVAAGKERVVRDIRRAMASLQREREVADSEDTSGKVG